jgi:hypothetical protein
LPKESTNNQCEPAQKNKNINPIETGFEVRCSVKVCCSYSIDGAHYIGFFSFLLYIYYVGLSIIHKTDKTSLDNYSTRLGLKSGVL